MYSFNIEDDSLQKGHSVLEVANNIQQLIVHPCNHNVILYMRKIVFVTRDGFQSSLYPLKFPQTFKIKRPQLTSAAFVQKYVIMLISGILYIYNPINTLWIPAKGINVKIDGISTNQCCINEDTFCKNISHLVIAYKKSIKISEVLLFLSTNGGLDFEEIRPEMPSEGMFEGAFIFPTISALSLLIRNNQKFHFRYMAVYSNLTSSPFSFSFGDIEPSFIQTVGMKGQIVIWSKHSLYFTPNHGQNVYPIRYNPMPGQPETFEKENRVILQVITSNNEEISVFTSDGGLFFGKLNMDAKLLKVKSLKSAFKGLLLFDKFDDLVIVEPIPGQFNNIFDFSHCVISVEQEIFAFSKFLEPCMVQRFFSPYQKEAHYIDLNESFNYGVAYVPKSKDEGLFLILVTDPFLVTYQAEIEQNELMYDVYGSLSLNISVKLLPASRIVKYDFLERMFPSELSTLIVDVLHKDILCRRMPAITIFLIVGCPPFKEILVSKRVTACSKGLLDPSKLHNNYTYLIKKKFYDPTFSFQSKQADKDLTVKYDYATLGCPLVAHYSSPWSPELQLWYEGNFVEVVSVEYVLFEVNGINDYSYELHVIDVPCISEVQNWTYMISQQTKPNPHTAWNSKVVSYKSINFRSCLEPGPPKTASDFAEYQVMGGQFRNYIHFSKRNGIYIFKAIVVNPKYSFCDLSVTFSVFVYGAQPETGYSSEMLLGLFILILLLMISVGFLVQ
ncbi:cation channel sperm-associated auxiliary subunit delta-like [Narcine bancroftii]|uniref:cation channel sperm-associated auxiliary subunit delta-like n=1 Tax=Narcine bancroftii TaxID=1343680 RepID=UPI003831AD5C